MLQESHTSSVKSERSHLHYHWCHTAFSVSVWLCISVWVIRVIRVMRWWVPERFIVQFLSLCKYWHSITKRIRYLLWTSLITTYNTVLMINSLIINAWSRQQFVSWLAVLIVGVLGIISLSLLTNESLWSLCVKLKSNALTYHLRSYLELTVSYGCLADSSIFVMLGEDFVVNQVEVFVCSGGKFVK